MARLTSSAFALTAAPSVEKNRAAASAAKNRRLFTGRTPLVRERELLLYVVEGRAQLDIPRRDTDEPRIHRDDDVGLDALLIDVASGGGHVACSRDLDGACAGQRIDRLDDALPER